MVKYVPGSYIHKHDCFLDMQTTCIATEKRYKALLAKQVSATGKARKCKAVGDEEGAKKFEAEAAKYKEEAKIAKRQLDSAQKNLKQRKSISQHS